MARLLFAMEVRNALFYSWGDSYHHSPPLDPKSAITVVTPPPFSLQARNGALQAVAQAVLQWSPCRISSWLRCGWLLANLAPAQGLLRKMCAAFAKPEVHLGSLTPTGELGDAFVLVADVSRVVKVVQGTQGTVGERTWLRVRGGQACLLPCNSRVRVSCCGLNVEFYLQQGAQLRVSC